MVRSSANAVCRVRLQLLSFTTKDGVQGALLHSHHNLISDRWNESPCGETTVSIIFTFNGLTENLGKLNVAGLNWQPDLKVAVDCGDQFRCWTYNFPDFMFPIFRMTLLGASPLLVALGQQILRFAVQRAPIRALFFSRARIERDPAVGYR